MKSHGSESWVSWKYSPQIKASVRKKADAYNILLFCTMRLLKEKKCRSCLSAFGDLLEDKRLNIQVPLEDRGDINSFGTQFRRLKKSDMMRLYKSYYDKSGYLKSLPGGGLLLSHALPSWEEIFV
jgi:hypothetical protein